MVNPLPVWKKTDKWKPASRGGGSAGFSVECPATGALGHCKPNYYAPEVLASALADEAGLPVPKTELANCEDKTVAVSFSWGARSIDARMLRETDATAYASEEFKAATRQASGLLPFHAWVGTGDLKDEHVVVRGAAPNEYEVASIDFADAFRFDGGVGVPPGPPALASADYRDAEEIQRGIDRIMAIPAERVTVIVNSLPDEVLPPADKERITKGLLSRRDSLESVFRKAGWLPEVATKIDVEERRQNADSA